MNRTLLLVMAITGCASASTGMRDTRPQGEVSAFDSCKPFIRSKTCVSPEVTVQNICMNKIAKQYDQLPDAKARREYLLEVGCPETVVSTQPAPRVSN